MDHLYKVEKNKGFCNGCQKEFTDRQPCFSAVKQSGDGGGLVREDYCIVCWKDVSESDPFSFWKGHHRETAEKTEVDADAVLDFFQNLKEAQSPEQKALRFVLALSLTRRKKFDLQGTKGKGDTEYLMFKNRKTGDSVRVEDPHLTEAQIQQATEDIKNIF